MAYGNQGNRSSNGYRNSAPAAGYGRPTDGAQGKKSEAVLSKFLRPSKSQKSTTFTVGDDALVIPANHRVVITALSEKRMDALAKSAKEKGFKGAVPTHELLVFPVTQSK